MLKFSHPDNDDDADEEKYTKQGQSPGKPFKICNIHPLTYISGLLGVRMTRRRARKNLINIRRALPSLGIANIIYYVYENNNHKTH